MKYTIILAILSVCVISFFLYFFDRSVKLEERNLCEELKRESEEYTQFYLKKWEKEMCMTHGIKINAPVK